MYKILCEVTYVLCPQAQGRLLVLHVAERATEEPAACPPPCPTPRLPPALPVRVVDDAPVDPLLQNLEVGHAGGLGEVQAQLLRLAVARVVDTPVVKKAQGRAPDTLAFIYRGGCKGAALSAK